MNNRKKAKRRLCLFLPLILLFTSLCGCQPDRSNSNSAETGENTKNAENTQNGDNSENSTGIPENTSNSAGDNKVELCDDLIYLTSRKFSSDRQAGDLTPEFQSSLADLTLRLLTSCQNDNDYKGGNPMISPLSIVTALAMAANGADGDTLRQMEDVIGGGFNIEELNQQLFNLYTELPSSERASLKAANSAWVTNSPNFTINKNFIKRIENTFDADVISVDYSDIERAVNDINNWCSANTDGMIPKVVSRDNIKPETVLCLINALCFDALWQKQINDYAVSENVFHGTEGDRTVRFLSTSENTYISGENVTGFLKPYGNGEYSFAALLPDAGISVSEYLASLDGDTLIKLLKGTSDDPVNVSMPEFSSDYSVSLVEILKSLGMTHAFDSSLADFSATGRYTGNNIFISDVIHKTHISVDQSGTRAAAVTAVIEAYKCCIPVEPKNVTLNRPFIYAITDTATGTPIFIGICENITD